MKYVHRKADCSIWTLLPPGTFVGGTYDYCPTAIGRSNEDGGPRWLNVDKIVGSLIVGQLNHEDYEIVILSTDGQIHKVAGNGIINHFHLYRPT